VLASGRKDDREVTQSVRLVLERVGRLAPGNGLSCEPLGFCVFTAACNEFRPHLEDQHLRDHVVGRSGLLRLVRQPPSLLVAA
jgi:hypothetical protein